MKGFLQKLKGCKGGFVKPYNAGFTIIEALIGITILATAVTGPMTAAQLGISASRHARDVLSASMLAGEAIELLRNKRDAEITTGGNWRSELETDNADFEISAVTGNIRSCASACPYLYYSPSTKLYGFDGDSTINDWVPSKFRRTVEVDRVNGQDNEVLVTVLMEWQRGGKNYSYEVYDILTNWYDITN